MQKYNIMGFEMVKVDDLKHAIRVLRKQMKENWFNYSDEQKTAALSAYDDVVRQLYREELRGVESPEERAAILEMAGDFIVCKRDDDKRGISYFSEWYNGEAIITNRAPKCMHFDYESKAEEVAERLGEGWVVHDTSEAEYENNKRMLKALLGETEEK